VVGGVAKGGEKGLSSGWVESTRWRWVVIGGVAVEGDGVGEVGNRKRIVNPEGMTAAAAEEDVSGFQPSDWLGTCIPRPSA
jgi:hypothetical protein